MIDPFTAFAAAQAAVKGIKAAIALGKDIQSASGDILKFFDAKDAVTKASVDPKKAGIKRSDTSRAMELVMQAHALRTAEKELHQFLIYSGQSQLWDQMLLERNRIVSERKAEELKVLNARAKKMKEINDMISLIAGAMILALLIYLTINITLEFLKD